MTFHWQITIAGLALWDKKGQLILTVHQYQMETQFIAQKDVAMTQIHHQKSYVWMHAKDDNIGSFENPVRSWLASTIPNIWYGNSHQKSSKQQCQQGNFLPKQAGLSVTRTKGTYKHTFAQFHQSKINLTHSSQEKNLVNALLVKEKYLPDTDCWPIS